MRILGLGWGFTKLSQFSQEGLDLSSLSACHAQAGVLLDGVKFRPLKLGQVLCVAIQEQSLSAGAGEGSIARGPIFLGHPQSIFFSSL